MSLKEKWVKALRSKEFEQGFGRFNFCDSTFCVLGVFCEVAGFPKIQRITGDFAYYIKGRLWEGFIPEFNSCRDLVTKNDKDRSSFEDLADYIERNVEVPEYYENLVKCEAESKISF